MKKALLFGASGFIGSFLLQKLLQNPDYDRVTIVARRDPGIAHPKLRTLLGDYSTLPGLRDAIEADDVFIALGTTKKKTPDQAEYYTVDHDYPVLAAKLAREKGATAVFLVSAINADPGSRFFYVRTKGEAERDIIALGYEHTCIFRPSVIMGDRPERRPLEKVLIAAWSVLNPVFAGSLDRYKGMEAMDIARAMNIAAKHPPRPVALYHWRDMRTLLLSAS